MNTIKLSNDFSILIEPYYEWDESLNFTVMQAANRYSFTCVGFYTDYIDVNGIKRIQHSYDRFRITKADYPKLCVIVRSNLLRALQPDEECGDYNCLDLFLRLTEIGTLAHIPYFAFKEIKEKVFTGTPEIAIKKAEIRLK